MMTAEKSSSVKNDIKQIAAFTARNIKLFFKDKGMLIGALVAPLIIMMLYALFLHRVFLQTFDVAMPAGITLPSRLINGCVAAYEVSSVLAVCCVTVAFVANMNMVADRVTGAVADISVTPVKGYVTVLGYYFATAIVTMCVCYIAEAAGFAYIAGMGWNMTVGQTFAAILDVFLASLFGTALSSIVCYFLKSSGAISAVSTIVSSVYGFICGAYYPISQFSTGMGNAVMCLPGTYFTGLLRTHFMGGYAQAMVAEGLPQQAADGMLGGFDVPLKFFGSTVEPWAMYTVALCSIVVLIGVFIAINAIKNAKRKKFKTVGKPTGKNGEADENE